MGGKVLTSSDGITWTVSDIIGTAAPNLNCVAFGNSVYVAASEGGKIYSSGDASTWTERTSTASGNLKNVAYLSGRQIRGRYRDGVGEYR